MLCNSALCYVTLRYAIICYVLLCFSALWINFPGLLVILLLSCLVGVVMYAFYSTCDPIKFGLIMASDQVIKGNVSNTHNNYRSVPM